MALSTSSLFLYGYTVSTSNQNLDFVGVSAGPTLTAVIPVGYYSLTSLMAAVSLAMQTVDTAHAYTVTADRSLSGGLQNRITIATNGAFLSLLFASGSHTATSPASLLGFTATDKTGTTTYTGSSTTGTALLTDSRFPAYNYLNTTKLQAGNTVKNVSSNGNQEALVYSTFTYWQAQFKYISEATADASWAPLFQWMTEQRLIEFTPTYTTYATFYEGWLESCAGSGNGTAYSFKEMLPDFPGLFDIGLMKFRTKPS